MIRIETAQLRVKRIQSRHGEFCVADLTTNIGEFKVKDPLLDQFEQGEYDCCVWISEIYLAQYIAFGKGVTEIRARLHDLQVLSTGDLRPDGVDQSEPDPMDEREPTRLESSAAPVAKAPETPAGKGSKWEKFKKTVKKTSTQPVGDVVSDAAKAAEGAAPDQPEQDSALPFDETLFDAEQLEQIEGMLPVKLDSTVDRGLLRRQAHQLGKRLGYDFNPKLQTWVHAQQPVAA